MVIKSYMYLAKHTGLILSLSTIFYLNYMKKPNQEEIPRSIIKGSGVIHADLNSSKGRGNLLFVSPKCTIVGLNNLPYMLFTTPEFNENVLPLNIKKDIHEIKELVLQPSFSTEAHKSIAY